MNSTSLFEKLLNNNNKHVAPLLPDSTVALQGPTCRARVNFFFAIMQNLYQNVLSVTKMSLKPENVQQQQN